MVPSTGWIHLLDFRFFWQLRLEAELLGEMFLLPVGGGGGQATMKTENLQLKSLNGSGGTELYK